MADALEGIRLKIERANAHIIEVSWLIDEFLAPDPYEYFSEIDTERGITRFKLRPLEEPPAIISVVCGEVLYSLRSALDHLVTAAATRRGVTIIKRTRFPIEETREKFEATLRDRKIEQRLPALAAVIKEFEPYKGGAELL